MAYPLAKKPLVKEIEAAEFLAEKKGVGIYIRGGRSSEGADFFMHGIKWELKTLNSPTNNAVANNIKSALKKRQSDKIIIDGRSAGLTEQEALLGIERAARNGAQPSRLIIILKGGIIKKFS